MGPDMLDIKMPVIARLHGFPHRLFRAVTVGQGVKTDDRGLVPGKMSRPVDGHFNIAPDPERIDPADRLTPACAANQASNTGNS